MKVMATLGALQPLVEALVFFVPLVFFLVILVRGSRRKHGEAGTDQPDR